MRRTMLTRGRLRSEVFNSGSHMKYANEGQTPLRRVRSYGTACHEPVAPQKCRRRPTLLPLAPAHADMREREYPLETNANSAEEGLNSRRVQRVV
jgi:hypothetical protein